MDAAPLVVVVADTSVLINIIHVSRLDLLGSLDGFRFVVPEQVAAEVTREEEIRDLHEGFECGFLHRESSTDPQELAIYADLRGALGRGEAATLAMAEARGWLVACDERGRFLLEARKRIGETRVIDTPGLMLLAIRRGTLTVTEADALKLILESRRFRMTFASFADLL